MALAPQQYARRPVVALVPAGPISRLQRSLSISEALAQHNMLVARARQTARQLVEREPPRSVHTFSQKFAQEDPTAPPQRFLQNTRHWHSNIPCNLWDGDLYDQFTIPLKHLHTRNQTQHLHGFFHMLRQHLNGFFQMRRHWHSNKTREKLLGSLWNGNLHDLFTNLFGVRTCSIIGSGPRSGGMSLTTKTILLLHLRDWYLSLPN